MLPVILQSGNIRVKGGDRMPVSKAQQRATIKYIKANYDRLEIKVPKGEGAILKAHAKSMGESLNEFAKRAMAEAMTKDTTPAERSETP